MTQICDFEETRLPTPVISVERSIASAGRCKSRVHQNVILEVAHQGGRHDVRSTDGFPKRKAMDQVGFGEFFG